MPSCSVLRIAVVCWLAGATFALSPASASTLAPRPAVYLGPQDDGQHCRSEVEAALARLKVDPDKVETITYVRQTKTWRVGPDDDVEVIVGFDAWVRPKAVKGYLVIDMDTRCAVRQVYTRGDFRLPGVPAY